MYYGKNLSDVTPSEIFDAWFDFANDIRRGSNAVISSAAFTLTVLETAAGATVDSNPQSSVSGSPTIEQSELSGRNTIAVQRINTLVAGNKYLLVCLATMDNGQILDAHTRFWCKAAA